MPSKKSPGKFSDNQKEELRQKLLDEYYKKYPIYEKIISIAKAKIEHQLIDLKAKKKPWERIEVLSRVKDFESAYEKLRRKSEGNFIKPSASFDEIVDMAALKIRVFPNNLLKPVEECIKKLFPGSKTDHKPERSGEDEKDYYDNVMQLQFLTPLEKKYEIKNSFEIQIVPFMLDAFMDIEHDIVYKPKLGISKTVSSLMRGQTNGLVAPLRNWPKEFSGYLKKYPR